MNPRILLVEDDPTTRAYLVALVSGLPAQVDAAVSMAQALDLAERQPYDLWLIDANLPDGSGSELLAALRANQLDAPALAHTAARDGSELAPLIAAGFIDVLVKPVDASAWKTAIRRALGVQPVAVHGSAAASVPSELPLWDDEAAARALGGSAANVAALRALFLAELPGQTAAISEGDETARSIQLHRLRASCSLVGAARLDHAVRALQDSLASDAALQAFLKTARDTQEATA